MSATSQSPEKLISLSELGRLLNVSSPRIVALHAAGIITADFTSNNSILFKSERLPTIRAAIKDYGLEKAIKANTRRES